MFGLFILGGFYFTYLFCLSDPIVQIEIDNSRNILYTRSEKGVIQVSINIILLFKVGIASLVFVCVCVY